MNQQNLNLYHIFYETALNGNISKAAKKLYISQPAISKALAKLENNLSVTLFIRNSRGVKLTPEGELLFKQIETAFHAIDLGEEQLIMHKEIGYGKLSIGISTTLCKYMLMPYLKKFMKENPHIKVSIFCQSSAETIAGLENGKLDIGIIGENGRMSELNFTPIEEIQDILVTTNAYMEHLRTLAAGSNDDLLSYATLMLLDKRNITRQYVEKYLLTKDIVPEQLLDVTTMDLLIDFAKIGMGIACVIQNFVEKELKNGSLVPFPIAEPIPRRKIGIATRKQNYKTASMEKFMQMFPSS